MNDTWVERGHEISASEELREYVAEIRGQISHMQTGLTRAAFGAVTGRSWIDTPGDERPRDVLGDHLEMTVIPAGTSARDAVHRQALAALVAALDAADRAALTAWLAEVNRVDPDRQA
ncbi:hypothetical protein ACFY9H_33625 [Streptomyces bacillaris]|uniref:hypothetical protein n=1 Tax=Streptomyces bacillaris TaxID=68179 RepID=UPI0036E6CB4B